MGSAGARIRANCAQAPIRAEDVGGEANAAHASKARSSGDRFRSTGTLSISICHAVKLVVKLDGKQHEWFADFGLSVSDVTEFPSSEIVASPRFPKPWTFEQAQVVPKSLDRRAPQ